MLDAGQNQATMNHYKERLALSVWGVIIRLLLPIILLRYFWLSRKETAYRYRWKERLGFIAPEPDLPVQKLWVHAVSLGEVRATTPLVKALIADGFSIVFTCTTPTGSWQIQTNFPDQVRHCYAPVDTPGAVQRFLRRCRPDALILVEAELWPNTIDICYRHNIPVLLANTRISLSSFRGYARFPSLFNPTIRRISAAMARTQQDVDYLLQLGMPPERIHLTGDLKYTLAGIESVKIRTQELVQSMAVPADRPILVAGSTHQGEERIVLQAMQMVWNRYPDALLILAPRQPRHFAQVAALLEQRQVRFRRRSRGDQIDTTTQVLLLDSTGELQLCYALAQAAFIGGSLVPSGGHNLLEPIAVGCPPISGPHLDNFTQIADALKKAGALAIAEDATELGQALLNWLDNPKERQAALSAGERLIHDNQHSLKRHREVILEQHKRGLSGPQSRR